MNAQTDNTNQKAARKPYHTPQLHDYGTVGDLTRAGGVPPNEDSVESYAAS